MKMEQYPMGEDLELVSTYNKARRETKITLTSSGVLNEIDRKSTAKKQRKMQMI